MGVVIELSASEMPRFLPRPEFSVPFASPSLRWGRKRRLRCFNPAAAALRLSPDCSRSLSPGSSAGPSKCCGSSPTRKPPAHPCVRCAPSPSPPLSPPSARPRGPIRLTYPPEDEEDGASPPLPPVPPPDPSSGAPVEAAKKAGDGGALAWSLRSRVHGGGGGLGEGKRKKRRVELWVSLSRDEMEEDFMWMTGAKPPRRSRRRSKAASEQLQGIIPGSWLPSKITTDRYKVAEPCDCRKVGRLWSSPLKTQADLYRLVPTPVLQAVG